MELKEYFKIVKENSRLFAAVIAVIIIGSFAYFILRPIAYEASLTLNITRSGTQETSDYKYDDFYRLQADEKFAETVVQWLKSPRVVADVLGAAGIESRNLSASRLSKIFNAENLSSQVVAVSFSGKTAEEAKKISNAAVSVISDNIEFLNKDQKENSWFKVAAAAPVIAKKTFDPFLLFVVSLLAGIFIAFWAVMIKHYLN